MSDIAYTVNGDFVFVTEALERYNNGLCPRCGKNLGTIKFPDELSQRTIWGGPDSDLGLVKHYVYICGHCQLDVEKENLRSLNASLNSLPVLRKNLTDRISKQKKLIANLEKELANETRG